MKNEKRYLDDKLLAFKFILTQKGYWSEQKNWFICQILFYTFIKRQALDSLFPLHINHLILIIEN